MNLLTLLLQTTDTLVTPPVLTPTVETAGDLNLWELACKGGIIMIPLLLLSLLSIYIFFERLQVIRRAAREDNTFMERIKDYIHEGDIDRNSAKKPIRPIPDLSPKVSLAWVVP